MQSEPAFSELVEHLLHVDKLGGQAGAKRNVHLLPLEADSKVSDIRNRTSG